MTDSPDSLLRQVYKTQATYCKPCTIYVCDIYNKHLKRLKSFFSLVHHRSFTNAPDPPSRPSLSVLSVSLLVPHVHSQEPSLLC